MSFCQNGWPENKRKVPANIQKFFQLKDNLFISDDLLFFSNKLVVPFKLQKDMITLLHEGHLGIEKVKSRARQIFYWPRMTLEIESFIKSCKICEKNSYRQQKETLLSYPIPERPWERVGLDIFTYANQSYLVVYDAYSNWLELPPIKDKSAKAVILALKKIFSVHGSPDKVICDNVPFDSHEFRTFATEWNFNIFTRSPNYPRSNGLAEKGVAIGKNIIKKCLDDNSDVDSALLQYRNTPLNT